MTDTGNPRILLLEADIPTGENLTRLIRAQGWEVICLNVSKEALALLDQSKSRPFDLFISSYQLPRMAGDDVLKAAKAVSPLTQRMLLVPSNQSDLVIRAINKAEIHACLMTPAADSDLVNRICACLEAFRKNMKLEQLKRVTAHQNKQMFQIAQKLRKKDQSFQNQISEKKAEILMLRSRLKAGTKRKEITGIDGRISALGIPMDPKELKKDFLALADYITALFDSAAAKAGRERGNRQALTLPVTDDPSEPAPDIPEMADLSCRIITAALSYSGHGEEPGGQTEACAPAADADQTLEALIEVSLSEDMTRAFARFTSLPKIPVPLNDFLDLLRLKEIRFGILDDEELEAWLKDPASGREPFCCAEGEPMVPGQDGAVSYHFETQYTNPGKIMEDGRIDFRDRGGIPFVTRDTPLAQKIAAVPGENGVTVAGQALVAEDPFDPVFIAGSGTRLSDDGLTILADQDGQPHLDYLGEVSVNPELPIDGDVDFQTGNIDFKGNIIVSGTVKEGFTVKGFSLTAREIEGATIDLTGDLHISDGITDANIVSSGNIYAKFINNSKVRAFGDIFIQKEIIDSKVQTSGKCENTSGVIISSRISAKGGIMAGKIGTSASKPAVLIVGVNDHIDGLTEAVDTELHASVAELGEIREKIKAEEAQDQNLYGQITEKAQVQEMAQNEVKALKARIAALKKANDAKGVSEASSRCIAAEQTAKAAEQELNAIFEIQNRFAKEIADLKSRAGRIEETNKQLVLKKRALKTFSDKTAAVPTVIVTKGVIQDTVVSGPNTSHTLREDHGRCQIRETGMSEAGLHFYEMEVTPL